MKTLIALVSIVTAGLAIAGQQGGACCAGEGKVAKAAKQEACCTSTKAKPVAKMAKGCCNAMTFWGVAIVALPKMYGIP